MTDKCFYCQERVVEDKYDPGEGKDIKISGEFCDLTQMTKCDGLIPECPNHFEDPRKEVIILARG